MQIMKPSALAAFKAAFRASLPVLLGYTTIGLAFGLVLVSAGLPWWLSPLMAAFVYAGAAQFMGVGLLTSGAGLAEIGVLTLLMNARHAVYGLSLLGPFSSTGRWKPYLVFGLTDETYGLLTTVKPPADVQSTRFYGFVTALNQAYWVSGCLAGSLLGSALPFDTAGLEFALTALFVVLLVEQLRVVKRPEPYLAAALAGGIAFFLASPRDFLLVSILLSIGLLTLMRRRLESLDGSHGNTSNTSKIGAAGDRR
jgi:4-azaleucine resistance transporter AzlC